MAERIVVAALVRDEAHKYLTSCLEAWNEFADAVVVLDDGSRDGSADLARAAGATVRSRGEGRAWGAESSARAQLWDAACDVAEPGDWIIVLDADMVPLLDPRDLPLERFDGVTFSLYDLWGQWAYSGALFYRDDAFWCAHYSPRLWMARRPERDFAARWSERGIHCGHFPQNLQPRRILYAPQDYALLHYGYLDPRDRAEKLARYRGVADQLQPPERAHAESIADLDPHVRLLCYEARWPLTRAS